jgi:pimeloyl-ACP methyl ester carboxylesterase
LFDDNHGKEEIASPVPREAAMSNIWKLVWFLSSFSVASQLSAAPSKWTSLDDFIAKVDAASSEVQELHDSALKTKNSVVIVFVPGILGSQLVRNGKTIWGDGSPKVTDLALRPGDAVPGVIKSQVLGDFGLFYGMSKENVYGGFFRALDKARAGRGSIVEFPYDWRLDIRENAKRFDQFLRSDKRLIRKKIIVVAHSMGGVLVWYWQTKYFDPSTINNPFVRRILFVGAPLRGSCEMIRMLFEGYRDLPAGGWFTNTLYGKLFRDVRPAAFTFPSVFQLLPRVPVDPANTIHSCLDIPAQFAGDRKAADYFDLEFWKSDFGRYLLNKSGAPWDQLTNGNEDEFFKEFGNVLDAAGQFRSELNLDVLRIPSVLFYSDQHLTVTRVGTHISGDHYSIEFPFLDGGDGRVVEQSAINEGYGGGAPLPNWRLDKTHGELPQDDRFVQYLVNDLAKTIRAEVALAYSQLALGEPAIFDAYFVAGGRLLSSSAITADLDPVYSAEVTSVVEEFNKKIITHTATPNPTYSELSQAQKSVPESNKPANRATIPTWETALWTLPPEKVPFAQGQLGFASFYGGNYGQAIQNLRVAYDAIKNLPPNAKVTPSEKQYIADVTGLLGVAYVRNGQCQEGKEILQEGVKLGNKSAKAEAANTCVEKSTGLTVTLMQ